MRPPRPWRPSKLRLLVLAERSPGASLSGFIARHIEQPGSRQSAPAAVKMSCRPSASACAFTAWLPGHDHHPLGGDVPAVEDGGDGAQVLDAAVRARPDEHGVDGDVAQRRPGRRGPCTRGPGRRSRASSGRRRSRATGSWRRSRRPGPGSCPRRPAGAASRRRCGPPGPRPRRRRCAARATTPRRRPTPAPVGAWARPAEVVERRLVGGDQAGLGAGLDRHVADGHAALHREGADRRAAVLDDVADAAAGADLADDGEDHVLGRDAGGQLALDVDGHPLRAALRQRLGGEHVLDLARADAERQGAERAVGGRVAVAAHDRHAGQRAPLLGADDVDDALVRGRPSGSS